MPWPEKVCRQFQLIRRPHPSQTDFHGAYNKLLYALFPVDTDFTIVPQFLEPGWPQTADFNVTFELQVVVYNKPVLILHLKAPDSLNIVSARAAADAQIRQRMADLSNQCPISTLHAISAFGNRLCFYRLDTTIADADILPLAIPRHPTRVTDTAPAQRWDCVVTTVDGEAKLRAIVYEIIGV